MGCLVWLLRLERFGRAAFANGEICSLFAFCLLTAGYAQDPLHVPSPLRLHHGRGGGHRGMGLKEAHPSPLLTHSRSPIPSGMAELPPLPESGHTFSLLTDPPHLPHGGSSLAGSALRGGAGGSFRGAAAAAHERVAGPGHLAVSEESWHPGSAAADMADVTYEMAGAAAAAAAAAGATAGVDLEVTADELTKLWQRATKYAPELGQKAGGVMSAQLPQVLAALPRERVARLVGIKAAVEAAANEAKAADAAVAAVSQVLQQKQKVAEKAHTAAAQAVQQFREFLLGCMEQYQETGVLQSGAAAQQAGAAREAAASAATPVEGAAAGGDSGGEGGAAAAEPAAGEGPTGEAQQEMLVDPVEGEKAGSKQEARAEVKAGCGGADVREEHLGNGNVKMEENGVKEESGADEARRDQQQQQQQVDGQKEQKQQQAPLQQQQLLQQPPKGKQAGKGSSQQMNHGEANGVADNGLMGLGAAPAPSAAHTPAETTPVAA